MIGIPDTVLICLALLVLLLLLMIRGVAAARGLSSEGDLMLLDDTAELPACPSELVSRVFSQDDSRFVLATKSPLLVKLFQSERKQVALVWIRQMSAAIQRTMREHKRIARVSHDLEFATELRLLLLYSELMLICGLLFVAVQSVGPIGLYRMAAYADGHAQRLTQVQQSFKAATSPQEFPRAGAA